MLIVISEDTFFETWKPTHAEEGPLADIPPGTDPACVWTECDDEEGGTVICSGEHFVNRIGYWVTEVPVPAGEEYAVQEVERTYEIRFVVRVMVTTEASFSEAMSRTQLRAEVVIDRSAVFAHSITLDQCSIQKVLGPDGELT